jgi:hypothetical protein
MNIIARKPRYGDCEHIVVDRGPKHDMQFVVATANPHSLAGGEWFWGHYFKTREEALQYFNSVTSATI